MKQYLNDNWLFTEQDTAEIHNPDYHGGKAVRLPHTCTETPFHYFDESLYQMLCWYRKEIWIPAEWQGDYVAVTFEGVGHFCNVFLNGREIGSHACGYTAFTVDISHCAKYGETNILAVKVDSRETLNQPPFGFVIDYMTFGGIYREVYLEHKPSLHIEDVFVKPEVLCDFTNLTGITPDTGIPARVASVITISSPQPQIKIEQRLYRISPDSALKAEHSMEPDSAFKENRGNKICCPEFTVENIRLWDVDFPVLYRLVTSLYDMSGEAPRLTDAVTTVIGFRKSEFRKDGYYLNGRKRKLRGLNRHQSYPYVGYAMPASMQRLDADILKNELGVNAVRTSHYPQSRHFIDRCDELGLLVFTEIPGWQHIGDAEWKKQAVQNTTDMVRQYRNHPSIILWGTRINESTDDDELYLATSKAAKEADPTRPTGGVRAIMHSHLLEDVYTYNDFIHDGVAPGCQKKKKVTPDKNKPYLISEYCGHMYPTKTYDDEEHKREHARRHANILNAVAAEDDIAGSFGWCMFDYNTHRDFGSGDRICYHGVLDMFRNPKPAAAVYSALGADNPVLEISSSMDVGEHPGCLRGDIYLYTNADSVRFYKNNVLIKEFSSAQSPYRHLSHGPLIIDDFIGAKMGEEEHFTKRQEKLAKAVLNAYALKGTGALSPGLILKALWLILRYRMKPADAIRLYDKYIGDWGGAATTYRFDAIKDGRVVKSVSKGPMTSMLLKGIPSADTLKEGDTYDVASIRLSVTDEHGNVLPYYSDSARILCEGDLALIGPDTVPFQGGYSGCYIKTVGKAGHGQVTVLAPGTKPVTFSFKVIHEKPV